MARRNPRKRRTYGPTDAQQKRQIKRSLYKERVKKLRPYFGDTFKAPAGFDLRKSPDTWPRNAKKKLTKFWRVIAPQIAQSHKPRWFRRPDHLRAAIAHTQQEDFLPGQKAALFPLEPGEKLTTDFSRKGKIKVTRQGVGVEKAYFDLQRMLADPDTEVERTIARLPPGAQRFKIMMGPHESRGTWREEDIAQGVMMFLNKYSDESQHDPYDTHSRFFTNWLFGIVGYYARKGPSLDKWIRDRRAARDEEIEARRDEKEARRAEARRTLTAQAKRKKKRRKRKGV